MQHLYRFIYVTSNENSFIRSLTRSKQHESAGETQPSEVARRIPLSLPNKGAKKWK